MQKFDREKMAENYQTVVEKQNAQQVFADDDQIYESDD